MPDVPSVPTALRPRPYRLPDLRPGEAFVEPPDPAVAALGALFCIENADPFDHFAYRAQEILTSRRTAFQDVVVARTYNYGLALFMDGAIQSAEEDEHLYHEMLVQPAMLMHPNPRSVLVVGGGEGASLREVLAHRSVQRATMVDIDREAVEICREFLPGWHAGALDDPRAELVFTDGRAFVENAAEMYDVAIIDVVDMLDNGPAQGLYTRQFYETLRRRMRPDGILMVQGLEFSPADYKEHVALARTLRTVFPEVHSFRTPIPSFLGTWGFLMASDWFRPQEVRAEVIDQRIDQRVGAAWMDHLSGEYLLGSFAHCKETRRLLAQPGPVLEDGVAYVPLPDVIQTDVFRAKLPALD